MKYFAFILSIYLLALNVTPCGDSVSSEKDAKTEISQAASEHQHQESDLCTPFCVCQCCHINATYAQLTYKELVVNIISTKDFLYLNGTEKDFTTSLLQPPRA